MNIIAVIELFNC